jgi:hypothetical protein
MENLGWISIKRTQRVSMSDSLITGGFTPKIELIY